MEKIEKKRALVTGASGMVGAFILKELQNEAYTITAIYNRQSSLDRIKNNPLFKNLKEINWVKADVCDTQEINTLCKDVDVVFHTAAVVSFASSDQDLMFDININGTKNIVNACLENKVPKLCHVSSIAALGNTSDGSPIDETINWSHNKNRSNYSITKFHSEMEVHRGIQEGLDAVIISPSVILGPGNWKDGSSAFFGTVAKGLKFYTSGGTGYVDVRDVAKACVSLCKDEVFSKVKNERYLLSSENLSFHYIFEQIAKTIHKPAPKIDAKPWMLSIAWRLALIASVITRSKPSFTKENAQTSVKTTTYNGTKISHTIPFTYIPIEQSIEWIGSIYNNEMNQ